MAKIDVTPKDCEPEESFEDKLIRSMIITKKHTSQQPYNPKEDPCVVDIQKIVGLFVNEVERRHDDVDVDELYEETKNMRLVVNAYNTRKR